MQILRAIVILLGVGTLFAGLALLAVGLGVPIGLQSISFGPLEASLTGIGTGFVVALFGLALVVFPMREMKRTTEIEEERTAPSSGGAGGGSDGDGGGWRRKVRIVQAPHTD